MVLHLPVLAILWYDDRDIAIEALLLLAHGQLESLGVAHGWDEPPRAEGGRALLGRRPRVLHRGRGRVVRLGATLWAGVATARGRVAHGGRPACGGGPELGGEPLEEPGPAGMLGLMLRLRVGTDAVGKSVVGRGQGREILC